MKNLLLASSALLIATGAQAQEPVYDWSGYYVGVQAGYAHSSANFRGGAVVSDGGYGEDGFAGGVHAGHDWQNGRWVSGFVADFDYLGIDEARFGGSEGIPEFFGKAEDYAYDIDWVASARMRAGITTTDRMLVYGTAGFAIAQIDASSVGGDFDFIEGSSFASRSEKDVKFGAALGLGLEYALTPNWSTRAEYLHYSFEKVSLDQGSGPSAGSGSFRPELDTVKLGISYRF